MKLAALSILSRSSFYGDQFFGELSGSYIESALRAAQGDGDGVTLNIQPCCPHLYLLRHSGGRQYLIFDHPKFSSGLQHPHALTGPLREHSAIVDFG